MKMSFGLFLQKPEMCKFCKIFFLYSVAPGEWNLTKKYLNFFEINFYFLFAALLDLYDKIDKNFINEAKFLHQYDETLPPYKEREIAQKIRDFYFPDGQKIDMSNYDKITKVKTTNFTNKK